VDLRNIVPAFVGDITLAIAPGTGTAGATLRLVDRRASAPRSTI
jgi:hypothetical protein